jgi:hypothetical protein
LFKRLTMIGAVLACTVTSVSAGGLDCTFPKSSPVEGVHGNSIYFRDGTAPAHVMVTHIDSEGRLQIRTAEVPTSGGVPTVFIGYVSANGILGVVAVNQVSVMGAGAQGRCTGLDAERAKPITPGDTPSGTIDLMRLAGVDCVADGLHTGVRRLMGNVADMADGSKLRVSVLRQQKDPDVTVFAVADDDGTRGAAGMAFWSRGVVVFTPLDSRANSGLQNADICK